MKIIHSATAGTLESSDAMISVSPGKGSIDLSISSPVIHQFGEQIRRVIMERLEALDVSDANVIVVDKGALDCTLKARLECAVLSAADAAEHDVPWGGAIR